MPNRITQRRLCTLTRRIAKAYARAADCADEIASLLEAAMLEGPHPIPSTAPGNGRGSLVVDAASCCVEWDGKQCFLGYTLPFRLLQLLAHRPNQFHSYDQLIGELWDGNLRSHSTIRAVARDLRRKLREAGMETLAHAIQGRAKTYVLLNDGVPH